MTLPVELFDLPGGGPAPEPMSLPAEQFPASDPSGTLFGPSPGLDSDFFPEPLFPFGPAPQPAPSFDPFPVTLLR